MSGGAPAQDELQAQEPQFTVAHQKVELDIDFRQQVQGKTEITIYPQSPNLKIISLNARQCEINNVLINGLAPALISHRDPCDELTLHFDDSNVHHHHLLTSRIQSQRQAVPEPNLFITLPKSLRIQQVDIAEVHTQNAGTIKISNPETEGTDAAETTQGLTDTSVAKYTPLSISIEFSSAHTHEAVQFVTGKRGAGRWPHAYTKGHVGGASASALFPCIDYLRARCTWDIMITCPRTVGDAIAQNLALGLADRLTLEEKNRERAAYENKEMLIVCSGQPGDETINKSNSTKKTATFSCSQQLSAQQLGFAVGPFEKVNLDSFRDTEDVAKLGENAVSMFAYCLPGRSEEVKNTCLAAPKAVDTFVQKYIACPVHLFAMCFVEDLSQDVAIFSGAAICSTHMLYPEDVIDPAQEVTRKLVHAIASQWSGINIIPEALHDTWVTVGMSHFMTDLFMRDICGHNEYRYRIRKNADLVFELDKDRPSIFDTGNHLHVDPSLYEFLSLKAPVVLFILDRRIHKSAGASKMPGIIAKILTRARTGDLDNNAVSTDLFTKTVERFYHASIADFTKQWVFSAGCPFFRALQRFNKKKLVVEMSLTQVPADSIGKELDPDTFVRDVREEWEEVYAGNQQPVFTGPMTIRIHEADGTPYEHIVQIKEVKTVIEVPYNTKYKRLKRSKRQRNKPSANTAADQDDEANNSLVYCLGDTLQGEDEIRDWRITEWSPDDEERMNAESYEWIRLDADFEWIARIDLKMQGYMFSSQLQQDRDVVAQLEAMNAITRFDPNPLVSGIMIRTLMDRRYFHGVRYAAAQGLVKHATDPGPANGIGLYHLKKAFEELFCLTDSGSSMTKPNDFSDQQSYIVQCAILKAISKVRNPQGHTPREVKEFLLDKLKFNDNSNNAYSDAFYVSKLMHALTEAIIARRSQASIDAEDMNLDIADEVDRNRRIERDVLEEIDRYRRMDEWTSSYQNLYSRSALECQAKLMDAGIVTFSPLHFLQYTRPGNYDMLRVAAYRVLVTPQVLEVERQSVLKYVLHCMVADASPWIRRNLQMAFGAVLARRAIGWDKIVNSGSEAPAPTAEGADGLVVEDLAVREARKKEQLRRESVEVALEMLKKELGDHQTLETALWAAVNYGEITLEDVGTLLDFCRMIYEPRYSLPVTLQYPRYYRVQHVGKGKLHFTQTSRVRTEKMAKWMPANAKPVAPAQPQPPPLQSRPSLSGGTGLKLKFKPSVSQAGGPAQKKRKTESPASSRKPTPTPPPTSAASLAMPVQQGQGQGPGRVILKISRPSMSKE